MMSFRIEAGDLPGAWSAEAGRCTAGNSWIEPFRHPALESTLVVSDDAVGLIVRERSSMHRQPQALAIERVRSEAFDDHLAAALRWPLNIQVLSWRTRADAEVTLRCGGWGTAPVCLVRQGDILHGHWDAARLYRHLPNGIDLGHAAYLLARIGAPYSRRTLFPDMTMLTERATARWQPSRGDLQVSYPPRAPTLAPRPLHDNADVLGSFEQLMGACITRWMDPQADLMAAELSGGLDSGVVSLVAARLGHRPLRSYGLIMPGENGQAQALRRQLLVRHLGAIDTPLLAQLHPPFTARRRRSDGIVPWGEFYHEAFLALLGRARADGVHTILTGIGGDEISTLSYEELGSPPLGNDEPVVLPSFFTDLAREAYHAYDQEGRDVAPQGAASRSVFEAARAGTAVCLRAGVWPLYPYATPELVDFCRSLPVQWRQGRRLQRDYLASQGLPKEVWRPAQPETFLPLLHQGMRQDARARIERMFADSALSRAGLVDPGRLMDAYRRYCADEPGHEMDALLPALVLEMTLRALRDAQGDELAEGAGAADVELAS